MTELNILYVTQGFERTARTAEDLLETNNLTIGQTFLSLAKFHGKTSHDYPRWISYEKNKGEFEAIQALMDECETDLDKVNLAADWLGEDPFG